MSKLIATLKQNNYEGDLDISTESPSLKKSPTFDFSCKFEENAFDKDDVIFFLNPRKTRIFQKIQMFLSH